MKFIIQLLFLLMFSSLFSQKITGVVKNTNHKILIGVHIISLETGISTITDKNGKFELDFINPFIINLRFSHLGYKTLNKKVDLATQSNLEIYLLPDYLNLDEVFITGTHISNTNKNLSMPVSAVTKKTISRFGTSGSAAILEHIPGVYVDASAGEVFTRVYTRGISISAEDDLGWYYVGLHEDGLPVTAVQFASFSPDLFHRLDGTLSQIQAVRGGSASITGMNTPGGVFNFISKPVSSVFYGDLVLNTGIENNGNLYNKIDATFSGPINNKLAYQIGVSHRIDQGNRNINYDFSKGGQLNYKLKYNFKKASLKLYGKYLDDHVNRWTGVTAKNWKNPKAAYDQNFKTTAQLIPNTKNSIPDGIGGYYNFDPSKGIHTKDLNSGLIFKIKFSDKWNLENNFKFSSKSANWQTSISKAKLPLNGFLPYFISGAAFPVGQILFNDIKSSQEVARVDNTGIFSDPPKFNYLTEGTLPFDAILGVAAWYKEDENDEFMDQLSIHAKLNNHEITGGFFTSFSKINTLTRASFAYATYEAQPKSLSVKVSNPGLDVLYLSDAMGYSNYGGLFFEKAKANVNQINFFVQDQWEINEHLNLDLGLRINQIHHKGSKDRSKPLDKNGGWDRDPQTAYDNGILIPSGIKDKFDYKYTNFSYSLGLNYEVSENFNVFGRFSKGTKAPELDYYFSNFSQVAINTSGPTQKIFQGETGIKFHTKSISIIPTFFFSQLENVGLNTFVFDQDTNEIFYTPMQFNSTRTFGLELESAYHPTANFNLIANATLQQSKALDFTVYNANGTIDKEDDQIISYNGNKLPFNPDFMVNITPEYNFKKGNVYFNWHFMSKREGNIANAFQLPSYSIFNLGGSYKVSNVLQIGMHIKNIFSSNGLLNFYGPDSFGANKDDVTKAYISNNPDGAFIVTPVNPRMFLLRINYLIL